MIELTIDGKEVSVKEGVTLLDILGQQGIEVPTMCFLDNEEHFPTCMVCMVKDQTSDQLLPACSTLAAPGMTIVTDDSEVIEARKTALELLLSDHIGECDAPCQTNCPAFMDIPLMNRLLAAGRFDDALRIAKSDIALPAVLGRICPAPCERACRRRNIDEAVSICLLKQFAADHDLQKSSPFRPERMEDNGKKICIIGSGPAGLSAAYFLLRKGYDCVIYDKNPLPGGAIRYAIDDDKLPKAVLDEEVEIIKQLGAKFELNTDIASDKLPEYSSSFDAVIIATGEENAHFDGLQKKNKSFVANKHTFQTNIENVFAIGSSIKPGRVAIRAVAHGKEVAMAIDQYLKGEPVVGRSSVFNSRIGRMLENDHEGFMLEATPVPRQRLLNGTGFDEEKVREEAARCMHCDCRKKSNCKLRDHSDALNANQKRFFPSNRPPVRKILKHQPLVYEPEKCIKCSICVRIAAREDEEIGLAYIGKGFDVEINSSFENKVINALGKSAVLCAEKCPTGALAIREEMIESEGIG
jgi:ferredoxin